MRWSGKVKEQNCYWESKRDRQEKRKEILILKSSAWLFDPYPSMRPFSFLLTPLGEMAHRFPTLNTYCPRPATQSSTGAAIETPGHPTSHTKY